MATGANLRVSDGQSGASHLYGPYAPSGTIRSLRSNGGDIFFIAEAGADDPIYYSRRSVSGSTVVYTPSAVVTSSSQQLFTCQDETMISVYSAMFFKASISGGSCGLWRMNQGNVSAVAMTIPGTMSSGNLMFEGQNRLYVEINTTSQANELVRYAPLGAATAYTIIDTDTASTNGSTFPSLSVFTPVTLPGSANFLDTLYYAADTAGGTNYSLYAIYKSSAVADTNLLSGAEKTTPTAVNLGTSGLDHRPHRDRHRPRHSRGDCRKQQLGLLRAGQADGQHDRRYFPHDRPERRYAG